MSFAVTKKKISKNKKNMLKLLARIISYEYHLEKIEYKKKKKIQAGEAVVQNL